MCTFECTLCERPRRRRVLMVLCVVLRRVRDAPLVLRVGGGGLQPAAAALIYVFCCRYKMHVSGCVGRAAVSEANRRADLSKRLVGKVG